MRRGRLNEEAPLGNLGETHSVGRGLCLLSTHKQRKDVYICVLDFLAPSPSPLPEHLHNAPGANPYMHEFRAPPTASLIDFDLDLNPDL